MLAKNLYLLLAREVSTDSNDNMNSLIKIIENFVIAIDTEQIKKDKVDLEKTPLAAQYKYSVATSWIFDELVPANTKVRLQLDFIDPKDNNIGSIQNEHELSKKSDRLNINLNLDVYPVTSAGQYNLKSTLYLNDKEVANAFYPYKVEIQWIEDAGRN